MLSFRSALLLLTVISSYCAHAQYIGSIAHPNGKHMRFENTLIISWVGVSHDPTAKQVKIFDERGRSVVELEVLRLVPEAREVGIYDVSARPGNVIAVAAVYASKEGNKRVRPAASLLTFDFDGRLLSASALKASRQVSLLEVDEESNIWTLTDFADEGDDPATLPMVVEYTSGGLEARKVLTRGMFPFHARANVENAAIGAPSMGYDSGTLWFWLPGSTDLAIVSTNDGTSVLAKTGLPPNAGTEMRPIRVVREPSGNVVGQFYERGSDGASKSSYYSWSTSSESWSKFKPAACDGDRLIGISDHQVYLHLHDDIDRDDVCVFEAK
jgi:hypothetical protein